MPKPSRIARRSSPIGEKEVLERYSLASLSMKGSIGKQKDSYGH